MRRIFHTLETGGESRYNQDIPSLDRFQARPNAKSRDMAPDKKISRREFIHYSAAGLAVTSAGMIAGCSTNTIPLPTRRLGSTGMEVSQLAFGGGSEFLANETESGNRCWSELLSWA